MLLQSKDESIYPTEPGEDRSAHSNYPGRSGSPENITLGEGMTASELVRLSGGFKRGRIYRGALICLAT